jgi:AraC-like DNA-binding protein
LLRTDTPVKQVAALVGFTNAKSFARAFRDWFGMSPTEYRRSS